MRLMGIDHGQVRIGVALSDPLGLFATPHRIVVSRTLSESLNAIKAIVVQEQVAKIVIGLPTDSQGKIGAQATAVIEWARALARQVDVPIVLWDESYSSIIAAEIRKEKFRPGRKARPLDDVAAAAILQEYLDAGGFEHEPGQALETFEDNP